MTQLIIEDEINHPIMDWSEETKQWELVNLNIPKGTIIEFTDAWYFSKAIYPNKTESTSSLISKTLGQLNIRPT
jgi:hypothetical protein